MSVSIKFISDLGFQLRAISSVVDLFEGTFAQPKNQPEFGIVSNPKIVSLETINRNLKRVQVENKLQTSEVRSLDGSDVYNRPNFSIEMETGTGKTYIFLRTILELNLRYNLKKFMIVVPSVAIREGTLANLRLTRSHFREIYDRVPYDFRVFSSERITELSAFCRSSGLEIMVITIQSFNKSEINTLYEKGRDDVLIAESGIDMLAQTNPVLILDEPHRMGSELSTSALNNLNPIFILRYSATHRDLERTNLVYSLGPAEAHDLGLVKKIDVIGARVKHESSLPSIRLLDIIVKPKIKAKALLKVRTTKGGVDKILLLSKGDSLRERTKNAAYRDVLVTNINGAKDSEFMELSGGVRVRLNESLNDTYIQVAKEQIENTIKTHFQKQERHKTKEGGIDEVSSIDSEKYLFVRRTFDQLFEKLKTSLPDWNNKQPEDVRGAYFSSRRTFKSIERDKAKIEEILRAKERLLSFESPTSFIFTHSALGEG